MFELAQANLTQPAVLCFALGALATALRSDLRLPEQVYQLLSIYLLFAIGLKGGVALSESSPGELWKPALAAIALGIIIPFAAYAILRLKFGVADAAGIAAHYGSVSAVTFTAGLAFVERAGHQPEGFLPALVAVMEVPGILVALLIARARSAGEGSLGQAMLEVASGKSILLLLGGLLIGAFAGVQGTAPVKPFFVDLFPGMLALFLLELGSVAARRAADLRRAGPFLAGFALVAPVVFGTLGVLAGLAAGMSTGGATVMGVLAGSASYIAAPAAVRIALPEANPGLYLTAALAITFPFNLIAGIPLFHEVALRLGNEAAVAPIEPGASASPGLQQVRP